MDSVALRASLAELLTSYLDEYSAIALTTVAHRYRRIWVYELRLLSEWLYVPLPVGWWQE